MRLALALGRRNLGRTWPNPSVGAVLIHPTDGSILAQGVTQPGGRPHAEVVALAAAGSAARGASLFVSLEPCSHHGRTPPCADAVVAAGVSRVVSAMEDPNPEVAGRGHARLREAGIEVRVGLAEREARDAHRGHVSRITTGRPFVTVKLARTADGFAGRDSERLVITAAVANAHMHMVRARSDAIMVGVETVLADDPRLDVRLPGLENDAPLRIVLDSRLRTPLSSRLVGTAAERATWLFTTTMARDAWPERADRLAAGAVEVIGVPAGPDGRVDLVHVLAELGRRGITTLLSEAGPTLAAGLAGADLIDEIVLLTSARRLDAPGIVAVRPELARLLASGFVRMDNHALGADMREVWRREAPCSPVS